MDLYEDAVLLDIDADSICSISRASQLDVPSGRFRLRRSVLACTPSRALSYFVPLPTFKRLFLS